MYQGISLRLLRYGQRGTTAYGLIDNLNLTYSGNQLQSVNDAATNSVFGNGLEFKDGANQTIEYTYDKNGNLTKDLNKNITSIQYNSLNLSSQVVFGSGNTISYEYGADGRKLRTVHVISGVTTTTDYCGNAIYENGVLKMLLNESGYVSLPDKKFHFYLKDHQGNVRLVADKDGNVEEANSYYPFGGTFTSNTNIQPYKYNGKELEAKSGLNLYDYGARRYDAALGRFTTVDPMANEYYQLSSYGYCAGNPICHRDEEGKWINNIIGAVIGGGVDLGIQVAANLAQGNGAFEKIDWVSVGASTLEGGLTSGLSAGKTLVVKAGVALTRNTISGMKDGDDIVNVISRTVKDIATDKVFGKISDVAGEGLKEVIPKVGEKLTKAGNQAILSNNKATELVRKLPGLHNTKTARKIATSKNGVVDVSKTIGHSIKNAPETLVKTSLKISKDIYEDKKYEKK